jgi:thiazolinyl imide reductase
VSLRVLVCGTGFGRVHIAALTRRQVPFELAGILARGSERSRACAREAGVPLFTDVAEVPADIDLACVVVLSDVNGGRGSDLARTLMGRGIHVLQESPLLEKELAESLRAARRHRVAYRVNTHYVHLQPVRRFLSAARALCARQRPLFVDAVCGIQVSYNLFDILGRALGGLRPWGFADPAPVPDRLTGLAGEPPFRLMAGVVAGVPLTLRVQNQLHPADPDNHAHFLHRVTVGTEGGTLTLVNTHGPVLWSPRPHLPPHAKELTALDRVRGEHLDYPSAEPIGPAQAPPYREILGSVWPDGVLTALRELGEAVESGADPLQEGQYHLTVSRIWQDATSRLGFPGRVLADEPHPLSAEELTHAANVGREGARG